MTQDSNPYKGVKAEQDGLFDAGCLYFGEGKQANCSNEDLAQEIKRRWNEYEELLDYKELSGVLMKKVEEDAHNLAVYRKRFGGII